jgi:hypothetical protein
MVNDEKFEDSESFAPEGRLDLFVGIGGSRHPSHDTYEVKPQIKHES